jgi:DEAD/DEAH box helicase
MKTLAEKLRELPPKVVPLTEEEKLVPALTLPGGRLVDRLARKIAEDDNPKAVRDIDRLLRLPLAYPLTSEEVAAVSAMHVKADAPDNPDGTPFRLSRVQAEALASWERYGALFGPIEVGGGKTLISLRVAAMAAEQGLKKTMLVVPAQVLSQLESRDISWVRRRVPLGVPFHFMGGLSRETRLQIAQHTSRGCFVVPYSLLSTADAVDLLNYIRPQLIVFDEAHNLKNKKSARVRRIAHFIKEARPKVVALSGTITNKRLLDFAHILSWCLGQQSPLPLDADVVSEWGALVDADSQGWHPHQDRKVGTGPLRPLVNWSNLKFPHDKLEFDVEGFRRSIQNRMLTAPGVVASPADSLGASLVISNLPKPEGYDTAPGMAELQKYDRDVDEKWITPGGDEIEWAMHKFAHRYALSAGLYHRLSWPDAPVWAKQHGLGLAEAESQILRAQEHHAALQAYHRELREWLQYHHLPGLDTPFTLGSEMSRHGDRAVGTKLYSAWRAAKDLQFKDMPERASNPVRVCDYKMRAAARWAKAQSRGGVLWYLHQGVGEWLTETLEASGVPAIHCPAGAQWNRLLTDAEAPKRFAETFAVASISAHGTGKNLQYFDRQLFVQFPRPEEVAQQTLGRLHRPGQEAEEVQAATMVWSTIDEIALTATLSDSVYVFETTASRRKVLFATWNPMPSLVGEGLLARAGADAKKLNIRQRKILEDQFGKA